MIGANGGQTGNDKDSATHETKGAMTDKDLPTIPDRVGDVVEQEEKPALKKPPLYRVLMLNDDYTPMEFVVEVLQVFFGNRVHWVTPGDIGAG